MYKRIVIVASILFVGCSLPGINIKKSNDKNVTLSLDKYLEKDNLTDSKSSYFYINIIDLEKAKQADSITYFYAHDNPSKEIEDYFIEFAKEIGDKHGAVIISPNTNIIKAMQLVNKISGCTTIEPILYPVIVFEDRRKGECYPFYLQEANYGALVKVLSIIDKALKNKININKKQFIHNTKYSIQALSKEYPTIKTFEIGIFRFIDYLGDKIYS